MPIFPLRDIAKFGVLTDPDSYDLPAQAWSFGSNVRFRAGRVTRSPVFRDVKALSSDPRFVGAFNLAQGLDQVFVGYKTGEVFNYSNGTLTAYNHPAIAASGWILFASNPTNTTTIVLNGTTVTFVTSGASGNQVNIGASLSATLSSLLTFLSGSADTQISKCTYTVSGSQLFITDKTTGTSGNSYTVATTVTGSYTNAGFNIQSGTLTGGYAAYADSASDANWTQTHLAGVYYVNRADREPWALLPAATNFVPLPNWPLGNSAGILRAYNSTLCGFNMTIGGINYPTMVMTSSPPVSGTVPTSWDDTDPTQITTQNILANMEGGITEANSLRNTMIIYGQNETWTMIADGSSAIYNYQPLFYNRGCINANCSVEVAGRHFVFGFEDIWSHDGVNQESICDERTREFIFSNISLLQSNRCFVVHDAQRKEVMFCYVSVDPYAVFLNAPDGCNRSATYNYIDKTWTFDDLPLVYFGVRGNVNTFQTYASTTLTYANAGGTYQSTDDSFTRVPLFVGDVNSGFGLTTQLYCFDWFGPGSLMAFPVDTKATAPMTLLKDGIDLDELGVDLRGYKIVNSIYPRARFLSGEPAVTPLTLTIGAADYFNQAMTMYPPQTYDGATFYKCDFNVAGRWLYLEVTYPDYNFISLSGFDFDMDVLAER